MCEHACARPPQCSSTKGLYGLVGIWDLLKGTWGVLAGRLLLIICYTSTPEVQMVASNPQLPFRRPQIPSNKDHKALNQRLPMYFGA